MVFDWFLDYHTRMLCCVCVCERECASVCEGVLPRTKITFKVLVFISESRRKLGCGTFSFFLMFCSTFYLV